MKIKIVISIVFVFLVVVVKTPKIKKVIFHWTMINVVWCQNVWKKTPFVSKKFIWMRIVCLWWRTFLGFNLQEFCLYI